MKRLQILACLLALTSVASVSKANIIYTVDVDVTGANFNFLQGDPGNDIINVSIANPAATAPYEIIGFGWDFTVQAFAPSWLSEAVILVRDGDTLTGQFQVTASSTGGPGTEAVTSGGIVDLVGLGLDFTQNSSSLQLEFYDSFDDGFSPEATILGGTVTFQIRAAEVPEPSALALLGLSSFGLAMRRRR